MQQIIKQMLDKYETESPEEKINALKEVIQEAVLAGLARGGFFKYAALYGGTALRIFYGLDRFSEDLDFSLIKQDEDFNIGKYFSVLEQELESLGLKFSIEEKMKSVDSVIKSAFIKGGTKENILTFYPDNKQLEYFHSRELIKIKFEIDTNPPLYANYEMKYKTMPSNYQVRLYDAPSLFAGKLHALICRAWKNRIKGRDLYDYIFYVSRGVKVNLLHLQARMIDSGYITNKTKLTIDSLREILIDKFNQIDFNLAKKDVIPFVRNQKGLDVWGKDFFISTVDDLKESN